MLRQSLTGLAALLGGVAAQAQPREPFITAIGDLPGGSRWTLPLDVSADGSVVVGGSVARGVFTFEAFRWTRAGGIEPLRPLETAVGGAAALAVTGDGTIIVGNMSRADDPERSEVFRWTVETGAVGLGAAMGTASNQEGRARAVLPDGETIVGTISSPNRRDGYSWSAATGLTWLGSLPGGNDRSEGAAISADGRVIVGEAVTQFSWRAFRWTADTGMQMIGPLQGLLFAKLAPAVSTDGTIIAGTAGVDNTYNDGYLWTEAGGFELLGADPAKINFSGVSDMSADGRVVVGQGFSHSGNGAWIWDRAHGVRDLHAVLAEDYGLDMSGWSFESALAVSGDGRTIVGAGRNPISGESEGYVAFLGNPVPCPGDATGDRQVNISDLGQMLSNYGMTDGAGESDGDTDDDGDIDRDDLQTLIVNFGELCPL